jgi:hypothetical protein
MLIMRRRLFAKALAKEQLKVFRSGYFRPGLSRLSSHKLSPSPWAELIDKGLV